MYRSRFSSAFPLGWSGDESIITEATTGLLYQPRMVSVEQSVECLAGDTEAVCPLLAETNWQVMLFPDKVNCMAIRSRTLPS
jgi:hypothetical protein